MSGSFHKLVYPASPAALVSLSLPAKAPQSRRTYTLDLGLWLADLGTTIESVTQEADSGVAITNIEHTDTVLTFVVSGGAENMPRAALAFFVTCANGDKEAINVLQPVAAPRPALQPPPNGVQFAGTSLLLNGLTITLGDSHG